VGEIASRIVRYISSASHVMQLLVSEAILTSKDKKYVLFSSVIFSLCRPLSGDIFHDHLQ